MRPTDALPRPADWRTATVGKAVEIRRGVSWSKDQEHSAQRDGAVPVVGISNVQERLETSNLVYISGLKPEVLRKKRLAAGWSVMVGSNGNRKRVGNAVLAKGDTDFLFASFLIAARPIELGELSPEFFYRWLTSEPVQAYLSASSEGTTGLNNLSHSFFRAMSVAYPPPEEQAAIARVLDAVDAAIERARAAEAKGLELKRALVQRLLSEGTHKEPLKKTNIGIIPGSWQVVPVGAVVRAFQYGLSVAMAPKGEVAILRMGNIQAGDVLLDGLKYVTLPVGMTRPYMLQRGDVLFNRTNSQEYVGKVGIFRSDDEAVFASYLIRLLPRPERIDNYFLGQVLNSYPAQCRIKRYATPGVQQVNINATNLGKVLIPVPDGKRGMDEQREVAAVLEQADAKVRSFKPVLQALQQLKMSLMRDLLTGRVHVGPNKAK